MGLPSKLHRNRKGASFAEYALLVTLLGGTSVSMVLAFGQIFIGEFDEATTFLQNALAYAQTDGAGLLALADYTPPTAAVGAPFSVDMSTLFSNTGLFGSDAAPFWTAIDLPAGLSIDPATGVVSGTPTTGGTTTATITVDQGDASIQRTYLFTVDP